MTADRRGTWLLAAGALAGAALAAVSLVRGDARATLDDSVVAVVDGRPISRERYERALEAVANDRRGGTLADGDRRRVLDRLVDEELLVSHAIELGLPATDPAVRSGLVRSVLDSIEAGELDEPTDAELRRFYEEEAWRFEGEPRFEVAQAYFTDEARARAALTAEGLPVGDEGGLPLPSGAVSLRTLTQRLGPTAARGIAELDVGETGGPWRTRGGWRVARLIARSPGPRPRFEDMEETVRAEHARARADERLRAFLDRRRRRADVVLAEAP